MKEILYIILIILSISCNSTKEKKEEVSVSNITPILITDIETDYGKLSDFVKEIQMIPLEFTDDCILGEIEKIVMTNSCIFVMEKVNQKGIYVFNHSGKYLYRIGNRGQGPGEFINLSGFSLNEEQQLIYLYDLARTKVLEFSFQGDFIKDIQMNYYADNFEYQDGLFYLYREYPDYGDPLCSLVIKNDKGETVNKYYSAIDKSSYTHKCIFTKLDNDIIFTEYLRDSVFTLTKDKLIPRYFIDYKDKSMSKVDRESILKKTRIPLTVRLESKKMAGIDGIFEINDKVFINSVYIFIPKFSVYDKKTKEVNTFSFVMNDLLFVSVNFPIGQYKDNLISIVQQESLQGAIDKGFKYWKKEKLLTEERAEELKNMIEERFPDQNKLGETNPVIFLLKVKK